MDRARPKYTEKPRRRSSSVLAAFPTQRKEEKAMLERFEHLPASMERDAAHK